MKRLPADTGVSVVYEPEGSLPFIDVVFVHGLQGHPLKTWSKRKTDETHESPPTGDGNISKGRPRGLTRKWTKMLRRDSVPSQAMSYGGGFQTNASEGKSSSVFWPADLLPSSCPRARILVFGYDTKITKYMNAATNKNSIYSHAKDLLFGLSREAVPKRPLVFVAHSLGGIIVKEMLARSSSLTESHLTNIVESTVGIVFLGTPHRGSPDFASVGEWARSLIGALGIETTRTVLDSLGLRNADLERAQEAFSALWCKFDFRVKTFQEGLGLTGIRLVGLGKKVVPDYSSSLGDQRERAETIQANHRDMCRFTGLDDPGYRQVSGEILTIYDATAKSFEQGAAEQPVYPKKQSRVLVAVRAAERVPPTGQTQHRGVPIPSTISAGLNSNNALDEAESAYLHSLWFPTMHSHRRSVKDPARHTCDWLFEHTLYADWLSGRSWEQNRGLLCLRGKPGSGKSVLMKEAYRRTVQTQIRAGDCVAAFFFNSKGGELEHSEIGALRTLLHQLLSQDRPRLARVAHHFQTSTRFRGFGGAEPDRTTASWDKRELEKSVRAVLLDPLRERKVFIFIDALDECDAKEAREHAYFWRSITDDAYAEGIELNVLLSARYQPSITLNRCPDLEVDLLNEAGITLYLEQRLRLGLAAKEPDWQQVQTAIVGKSRGVFVWVVLAVDEVIQKWERGDNLLALLEHLDVLPRELSDLYERLLESVPSALRLRTLDLFYWAVLSVRPLRLHEWHHVLAFIRRPPPASLAEWRASEHFTKDENQLERQIRTLSRGLLEVTTSIEEPWEDNGGQSTSSHVFAGSLDQEHGDTRVVQVIHDSVRQYFRDQGFQVLDRIPVSRGVSHMNGHIFIMNTCLNYLEIKELDALAAARIQATQPKTRRSVSELSADMARSPLQTAERATFSDDEAPFGTHQVDILRWIAGVIHSPSTAGHGALSELDASSESSASISSELLEDYPALLFYATQQFLTHFSLAANCLVPTRAVRGIGAVSYARLKAYGDRNLGRATASTKTLLRNTVVRLSNPITWERLVALGEGRLVFASLAQLILSKRLSPSYQGHNIWKDRAQFIPRETSTEDRGDNIGSFCSAASSGSSAESW